MDIAFYYQNFGWEWLALFVVIGFNLTCALRHEFREPAVRDYARKLAWTTVFGGLAFSAAYNIMYLDGTIGTTIGWWIVCVIEMIMGAALALVYLTLRPKTGAQ